MYWVNSVLWHTRIGKSLRNSLFQGLVFGLIFRSCKDYFFSFLLTRLLFHRNVIGFQFSAKKIFAKCNCFDNCQTMFLLSKLYLLILMPLCIQNQQGTNMIHFYSCHLPILLKFRHSEKATKIKWKIVSNFLAFLEQMNFSFNSEKSV
jgi:hypothetical protein